MISQKYIFCKILQNFVLFLIGSQKLLLFLIGSQNSFFYVILNSHMVMGNHFMLSRFCARIVFERKSQAKFVLPAAPATMQPTMKRRE